MAMKQQHNHSSDNSNSGYLFIPLILLVLVLLYVLIYLYFLRNVGFPTGPGLGKEAWLSFFGTYLSFSGTLLMSVAVYRQDRRLARLSFEQAKAGLKNTVEWIEFGPCAEFDDFPPIVHVPSDLKKFDELSNQIFFCNYLSREGTTTDEKGKYSLILYLSISPLRNICISEMRIEQVSFSKISNKFNTEKFVTYTIMQEQIDWLLPGERDSHDICCILLNFPKEIPDGNYVVDLKIKHNSYGLWGTSTSHLFAQSIDGEFKIFSSNDGVSVSIS